jgi:alpha-beta hydrolase superfamily lysophospholipase
MKASLGLLPILLLALQGQATASDLAREQRLASEIEDAIIDGEPIYLKADGHPFLAIAMENESEQRKGAVVILHGRGYHPNWRQTIYPLRTGLPAHGWDTLSIQLPVLEKSAKYNDYVPVFPEAFPRIEAAIAHLREQGIENIVLIAHSCGAHMANHWLAQQDEPGISAYVGIGMGATDYKQPMQAPFPFDRLKMPILDIYGGEEYPAVKRLAPQRLQLIRQAGHPQSAQQVVPGADHYFNDAGPALLEAVAGWLDGLD